MNGRFFATGGGNRQPCDAFPGSEPKVLSEPQAQSLPKSVTSRTGSELKNMGIDQKAAYTVVARVAEKLPAPAEPWPEHLGLLLDLSDGKRTLAAVFRAMERTLLREFDRKEKAGLLRALRLLEEQGAVSFSYTITVTEADVRRCLSELGIVAGDRLIVHSSLGSIGRVEGGPAAVCRAVMETVGPEGTILMPTFNHAHIFRRGEENCYDPLRTPGVNGAVPEHFRTLPGVYRSLQPTHPFAGWGKNAREWIRRHHQVPTLGEGSPLHLLELAGGKALLIGAPWANTYHHVVEMTDYAPCIIQRGQEYPVRLPDGRVVRCRSWTFRDKGCPISEGGAYHSEMRRRGLVRAAMLGNAEVLSFMLADCRTVLEDFFGGKMPGYGGCRSCPIRPAPDAWSVPDDWDRKLRRVRPDTSAFVGDYDPPTAGG